MMERHHNLECHAERLGSYLYSVTAGFPQGMQPYFLWENFSLGQFKVCRIQIHIFVSSYRNDHVCSGLNNLADSAVQEAFYM